MQSIPQNINQGVMKVQTTMPGQFEVWKRQFYPNLLNDSLQVEQPANTNSIDWTADLFDTAYLPNDVPADQVRSYILTNKQTQILSTLVPDEIISFKDFSKKMTSRFVGVLLFADVSGYTALCEIYNNSGKGGVYRLTATLNGYIGSMVEVIYSRGGDVLKFSGDAFLAIWRVKRDDIISHVVHDVLCCALFIQQTLGSYETDVKVFLKVKLAISAGNITFAVIGDDLSRHYVAIGTPIDDVKRAEHSCVSGDVVLSESAFGHCDSSNYEYMYKDESNVKVTRVLYNPRASKRQVVQQNRNVGMLLDMQEKKRNMPFDQLSPDDMTESAANIDPNRIARKPPIRPSVLDAAKRQLGAQLRAFCIPPIVQQVDANQPLEFLTEMREVTVMFINLIPCASSFKQLVLNVDEAYCTILRLVRSAMGCVNKVSLFDKDVMALVIFGLRGYKHESESESGLKCAYNVRKSVSELEGWQYVSVGVTTGMVYCGVVGHPLRREYTAIGATVNMAARIMCAYPGKVTCDQTTFLHAKLPPSNFILQEPKELKGIGTVGPIYEYTEDKIRPLESSGEEDIYPLLGRNEQMEMFRELLRDLNNTSRKHSGLLITGESQIGRSRLLDEMVSEARMQDIPTVVAMLNAFHSSTPYAAIQQIFNKVLSLKEFSTAIDREEGIISLLGNDVSRESLCYLNDVMQVKFMHSRSFLSDSLDIRKAKSLKMFTKLICSSFNQLIIAIDDVHHMDQHSWDLMRAVIEGDFIIVAMTMYTGRRVSKRSPADDALSNGRVVKARLSGLLPSLMAPLACQMLNVQAIDKELESIIQNKSGGNPGWVKSFLLSLIESGGLEMMSISKQDETKLIYLAIPDNTLLTKSIVHSLFELDQDQEDCIQAYLITPGIDINEKLLPQNVEAMIMTAFDCLTPYEQLLLKCGSVLGHSFPRNMLSAIMPKSTPHQTARAVKRLFEMRMIECYGRPSMKMEQVSYTVHSIHNTLVSQERTPTCYCDIKPDLPPEEAIHLPKYAFCRLLHFKVPLFRDITYELLPGNQKKEFHARAVDFLEKEAHKCASCGGGEFTDTSGLTNSQQSRTVEENEEEVELELVTSKEEVVNELDTFIALGGSREALVSNKIFPVKENIATSSFSKLALQDISQPPLIEEKNNKTQNPMKKTKLKRSKSIKKASKSCMSIERNFPNVDFRNCECPLILSGVYQQLINHCSAAGLKEKHIKFLIESGAAAIEIGNNTQALQLLEEATQLSRSRVEGDNESRPISQSQLRFNLGKIRTITGQAYLELGQLKEARSQLVSALSHFGTQFRKWGLWARFELTNQQLKQWFKQQCPLVFIGTSDESKAILCNEVANTLSHLCNLFMMQKNWLLSKVAALEALNFSLRSDNSLIMICVAYSNLIDVCHHYGELEYCRFLERAALRKCKKMFTGKTAPELMALGRLYNATFNSRLLRGELNSAVYIGFKTLTISSRVFANNVKLFVIPLLVQGLVCTYRLDEAVNLMKELAFTSKEDLDRTYITWYYALCLDLLLDGGFTLEAYVNCRVFSEGFVGHGGSAPSGGVMKDSDSLKRLTVNFWLWALRNEEWEEADKWQENSIPVIDIDDSYSNLMTALKYLECLLITLTKHINSKASLQTKHTNFMARKLFKKLKNVSKKCKAIIPRYLHMKGYYQFIRNRRGKGLQRLREGRRISVEQGNVLETAWIDHSTSVWTKRFDSALNSLGTDFWKNHSKSQQSLNWHHFQMFKWSAVMFSLPLPSIPL